MGSRPLVSIMSEIDKHTSCLPVQLAHQADLLTSFSEIFLIDAYGIDPDQPTLISMPKTAEGVPAIHSDLEGGVPRLGDIIMVETEYWPRGFRVTPYIRQGFKGWCIFNIDGA